MDAIDGMWHIQTSMSAAQSPPPLPPQQDSGDQHILMHSVTYERYLVIRDLLEDQRGLRVAYSEGVLELMSPSLLHEKLKSRLGRLLELFALEREIALFPCGSATFRSAVKERGVEPDECYFVGADADDERKFPDLAIEVIIASGGLDKLPIYSALGVREVWIFWETRHAVYVRRGDGGYDVASESVLLCGVDVAALARYARRTDSEAALREYRAQIVRA